MEQPTIDRHRRYTVEEYLALNDASDIKYEYWDGLLVPFGGWKTDALGNIIGMAGTTDAHDDISSNLIRQIGNRLVGTPCKVNTSELRVRSPRSGRYYYPDLSVTCGPRQFFPPDSRMTLTNPQVLIEILSPSTGAQDRGEKLQNYIAIESLQEYLLVSQDEPSVQRFFRSTEGSWIIGAWAEGLEAELTLQSLDVSIPLAEVYAGVEFPSDGTPAATGASS